MNKIAFITDQNHPQIKAYKQAVEKGLQSHHVLPRGEKWILKRAGASRATAVFSSQGDAIIQGKMIASSNQTNLLIHDQGGRIRERV